MSTIMCVSSLLDTRRDERKRRIDEVLKPRYADVLAALHGSSADQNTPTVAAPFLQLSPLATAAQAALLLELGRLPFVETLLRKKRRDGTLAVG